MSKVVGYFAALFFLKSETYWSFGGGGVSALRCCAISNAFFGADGVTVVLEFELLEDEENPVEGLTALGLLEDEEKPDEGLLALGLLEDDENPPEREEENPLERDEEKPPERVFASALSIAGKTISDSEAISRVIYFFIFVLIWDFNISLTGSLSRLFSDFSQKRFHFFIIFNELVNTFIINKL